jgi:hypothetical protein
MEQSIATSQAGGSRAEQQGFGWRSISVGLSSAIAAVRRRLTSSIWRFSNPLGAGLSATIDIDRIAAQLSTEHRGRSDGKDEQPPSTEEVVAGTQKEIVVYFKELQRRAQSQVVELVDKLRGIAEEIDLQDALVRIRDIPSRCENEILRLSIDFQSRHEFMLERETQQQQNYEAFREYNYLTRIAKYPTSLVKHFAFIAILISAGAISIGHISSAGADGESLVPAGAAISISLIGVLVPFILAATVFRSVNHIDPLRKSLGWVSGGITIAAIAILAYFVANDIVVMSTNPGASVRAVVDAILVAPAAIGTDVAAWTGFVIVMLVGLLAILVGYSSDDPYPGYGATQRAYYGARDDRELVRKQLRNRINLIVDQAEAEITELVVRLKAQVRQYSRLLGESKQIPARSSDYEIALEDACNILLDRYRAANRSCRRTEVPISFSEHICFRPEPETAAPMFDKEDDRLMELHRGIAELEGEAVNARKNLRHLNWRAISAQEDNPLRGGASIDYEGDDPVA